MLPLFFAFCGNISDDIFVIGHIGRFVETKNHKFIIDVFNEIYNKNNKAVLLLIGQGPLVEEVKEKVNRLELTNNVIFLGQRNDVNEFYQAFDLFIFPSLYEGLGLVAVEAQAAGLKCVCSKNVPAEVNVTNNVSFIDLKESSAFWCDKILNKFPYNRKDFSDKITLHGYNIEFEVKKLEDEYIKFCE